MEPVMLFAELPAGHRASVGIILPALVSSAD